MRMQCRKIHALPVAEERSRSPAKAVEAAEPATCVVEVAVYRRK